MNEMSLPEYVRDWEFVRFETLELLESLNDKKLSFTPTGNEAWQPLSYQFACIGRTQLVYAWAMAKGFMDTNDFSGKGLPNKQDITTRKDLEHLLAWANQEWYKAMANDFHEVLWLGKPMSKAGHVYRLISHERLHHGQMISYFTLGNFKLPKEFKRNWAL